jgi:hypothetical protein
MQKQFRLIGCLPNEAGSLFCISSAVNVNYWGGTILPDDNSDYEALCELSEDVLQNFKNYLAKDFLIFFSYSGDVYIYTSQENFIILQIDYNLDKYVVPINLSLREITIDKKVDLELYAEMPIVIFPATLSKEDIPPYKSIGIYPNPINTVAYDVAYIGESNLVKCWEINPITYNPDNDTRLSGYLFTCRP